MRISSFFFFVVLDALHISLDGLNFCLCCGLFLATVFCCSWCVSLGFFFPVFLAFLAVCSSLHLVTLRSMFIPCCLFCASCFILKIPLLCFWVASHIPPAFCAPAPHLPAQAPACKSLFSLSLSICASVVKVRLWLMLVVSVSHAHFSSTLAWSLNPFVQSLDCFSGFVWIRAYCFESLDILNHLFGPAQPAQCVWVLSLCAWQNLWQFAQTMNVNEISKHFCGELVADTRRYN